MQEILRILPFAVNKVLQAVCAGNYPPLVRLFEKYVLKINKAIVGIVLAGTALVSVLVIGILCVIWKRKSAFDKKGAYDVVKVERKG